MNLIRVTEREPSMGSTYWYNFSEKNHSIKENYGISTNSILWSKGLHRKFSYRSLIIRISLFFLCFKRGTILILLNFSIFLCWRARRMRMETRPEGPTIVKTSISVLLLVIIHFHRPMPNYSIPYHFMTRIVSQLFSITKHIYATELRKRILSDVLCSNSLLVSLSLHITQ